MDIFSNNLLSKVNHLSANLGPVIALFDGLLDRITPKMTAQACGGSYCGIVCGSCCRNCSGDYESITYQRYTQYPNCDGANCYVNIGCTYC